MKFYLLTAAVVVATTAAAVSYDSASLPAAGIVSSPYFLWLAANVIVVFLFSSHRGHAAAAGDAVGGESGGGDDEDMGMYTSSSSSGHESHDDVFAVAAADLAVVAAPAVTTTVAKKKARTAKRSSKAPAGEETPAVSSRVSKASAAGVETPRAAVADDVVKRPIVVEEEPWLGWNLAAATSPAEAMSTPDVKKSAVEEEWPDWAFFVEESSAAKPADAVTNPIVNEEEWSAWVLACTSTETNPSAVDEPSLIMASTEIKTAIDKPPVAVVDEPWPPSSWTIAAAPEVKKPGDELAFTVATGFSKPAGDNDGDDVSMDSMWETILQGGARPVTVRKSETWSTDERRRRRERAAESAVAARKEIRKPATATNMTPPPSPQHARAPPAPARQPWRMRDALPAMPNDELMRRAESLIRRHHEQLRLQRQESEQRQALELQRRRPLIRV